MFHKFGEKYPKSASEGPTKQENQQEKVSIEMIREEWERMKREKENSMKCVYAGPEQMDREYQEIKEHAHEMTKIVYAPPEYFRPKKNEGQDQV